MGVNFMYALGVVSQLQLRSLDFSQFLKLLAKASACCARAVSSSWLAVS
jgi:hypothetical protein